MNTRPFPAVVLVASVVLTLPNGVEGQVRLFGDCATPPNASVDVLDGLQLGRLSVALDPLPQPGTPDFVACDVDSDGAFTVLDNLAISRFSVGLLVSEPVGEVIVNLAPAPDPGGPYSALAGASVTLDGTGSSDDWPPIAGYAWDLDGNGTFETPTPTAQYDCAAPGSYVVPLSVTDGFGEESVASATVDCLAAFDIAGQWTDASGVPVASVPAGTTVYLNLCTTLPSTQAFQAVLSTTPEVTRTGIGSDLVASSAQGICGDPGSSDGVNQYLAAAPPTNPFSFQNFSLQAGPGAGLIGLARIPFTATSVGTVSPSLTVSVWQLFTGTPPATPQVEIAPLVIS